MATITNSGLVFPITIAFNSTGSTEYNTSIVFKKSGARKANINWINPLRKWDASTGVKNMKQMNALIAFFNIHSGKAVPFLWYDYLDSKSDTFDEVGVMVSGGVFVETKTSGVYQAYKRYAQGSVATDRKVTRLKNPVQVKKNGDVVSDPSIDYQTGLLTITATDDDSITWSGEFYIPAVFDTDSLDLKIINKQPNGTFILDSSVPIVEYRE